MPNEWSQLDGSLKHTKRKRDSVNHPAHYTQGKIEVWDFIADQALGYFLGNAIKYLCRCHHKGHEVEDLHKAKAYISKHLALVEKGGYKP